MANNDTTQKIRKILGHSATQAVGILPVANALANAGSSQIGFDDTLKRETQRALEQQAQAEQRPIMQRAMNAAAKEPETPPAHVAAIDGNGQFTFAPNPNNAIVAKGLAEGHPELKPSGFFETFARTPFITESTAPPPMPTNSTVPTPAPSKPFNPLLIDTAALLRPRVAPTPATAPPDATAAPQPPTNPLLVDPKALMRPRTVAGMPNTDAAPLSPLAQNDADLAANNSKDNVRRKGWQSALLGAGTGFLQGLASGGGIGAGIGGAVAGTVGGAVNQKFYDQYRQNIRNQKLEADRARIYGGLQQQAALRKADNDARLAGVNVDRINAGIDNEKADNQRADENLALNKKKANAKDTFDEWRMRNGDTKTQNFDEYQKARIALGDRNLLTRVEFNEATAEYRRELLAQKKQIADENNDTRREIAGQTNDTRRAIANQNNNVKTTLLNVKTADEANNHLAQIKQFMGNATIDGLSDDGLTRIKKPRYSQDEINQKVQEYLTGLRPEIRKKLGQ